MPEFEHNGKVFNSPVEFALERLSGRWKIPILWRLRDKTWRYGQLKRDLIGITHKMLTRQLRELAADKLIIRKSYPVVPPKVEYSISEDGRRIIPFVEELKKWGEELMKKEGIKFKLKLN